MTKRFGFTLAEVLITLGIIGVVAAITMPVLIQNQTHRETEVKLQKFYSVFNQALKRSQLDNAEMSTWDKTLSSADFVDKYIRPYLQVVEVVENVQLNGSNYGNKYILADGTAFGKLSNGIIFYPKKPKDCPKADEALYYGTCSFYFGLDYDNNNLRLIKFTADGKELSYKGTLALRCGNTASGGGMTCTTGIAQNGWKIPEDYPLKIKY